MIQRIQSIWLLLAAITILCLLFAPVFTVVDKNIIYVLDGTGIKEFINGVNTPTMNIPLLISVVLAGLISLINIFNFRNRTLQKRIASLNILLILGLSFWLSHLGKNIPGGLGTAEIGVGLFLPVVAIIFTLLAVRGIKNDEKLIRSADRLR
ncbi:MAG: DUF4293 family protein [Chitinophagaceae bacterium]|nr:MAG: DUF4293 family protein [Chitinophagaceae bacterium]